MILTRTVAEDGDISFPPLANIHDANGECYAFGCVIHAPTEHPLSDAPYNWREDRRIMERICEHGVGHPDHDAANYERRHGGDSGLHGCDGCCVGNLFAEPLQKETLAERFWGWATAWIRDRDSRLA
jgi:hypothetical protein